MCGVTGCLRLSAGTTPCVQGFLYLANPGFSDADADARVGGGHQQTLTSWSESGVAVSMTPRKRRDREGTSVGINVTASTKENDWEVATGVWRLDKRGCRCGRILGQVQKSYPELLF